MLDRIGFVLGEAFIALRRNGFMTFAAVSTIALALFLFGGLGYLYWRVAEFALTVPGKFEMRVFLKDGASLEDIHSTAASIRSISGVSVVSWIPKDKAWQRYRQEHPDSADVENPLPDAFKVTISNLERGDAVAAAIRALPAVSQEGGVQYLQDVQRFIDQLLRVLRLLGTLGGGVLFVTGGILIYNAIRLTVMSRRLEIRIMQLVGASSFTVRFPFLLEGIVQGLVGGAVAALLIDGAQRALQTQITTFDAFASLPPFPLLPAIGLLTAVGALYGFVCSWIAVLAPLKYR